MNQIALSRNEIENRVNSGNSFSKLEMTEYRNLITIARQEKRQRLSALTGSQIGTVIEQQQIQGFVLTDCKLKQGARVETYTYTFKKKTTLTVAELLQKQIEKLTLKLNAIAA